MLATLRFLLCVAVVVVSVHLPDEAFTSFSGERKEVILRNGVLLLLRQLDPSRQSLPNWPRVTEPKALADSELDGPFILFA